MGAYRVVTACRLCDSTDLAEALNLGETPLANELDGTELFPLVVNRCGACGHHQLSIAVAPERLWGPNYPYASGTSPVFRKHLEALADEVAALKPGGVVLEIAANDGTLVRALKHRGLETYGLDPCGDGKDVIAASWPYEQMAYALPNGPFMKGQLADCILALNVFAHVDDLHGFTAAVKEALAPDGVFIVEVGYLPEQVRRGQFDTVYAEHLSYHSITPLCPFFRRHGLTVESTEFNESQGGTLRLYVRHYSDDLDWRDRAPFTDPVVARAEGFMSAIESARAYLTEHTKSAKLICGYGAPAKLTTLAYTLDLPPIVCIGEDNPLKVGRTTPGQHIPIVSVADMLAREPDCIIVFAWNFFDDIRDKLRRLGYAGDIVNPMGAA